MFKKNRTTTQAPRRRQASVDSRMSEQSRTFASTFRRGRTLTGSISGTIKSSNEVGADMLSPRAHVHHLSHHRRHLFRWFALVSIVALALYIMLSQLVAVVSIRASDADMSARQQKQYQQLVDNYLAAHPNERLFPLLKSDDLTTFMTQTNPEVSAVKLKQTGSFGVVQADITFRRPVARWSIGGASQYVDQSGVVFSVNMFNEPSLTIVDANTTGQNAATSSSLVASRRFLGFVGQIVGGMKQNGMTVTKATIPLLTTRQLEVNVKGLKYKIKLTIDRSAGEQVEDAVRTITYQRQHDLSVSYIDVRVGGKAFYR